MKKILCVILSICMIAVPPAFSANEEMSKLLINEDFEAYEAAIEGEEGEEIRPTLTDGAGTYFKAYDGSTNDIYISEDDGNNIVCLNGKTDWANKIVLPSEYVQIALILNTGVIVFSIPPSRYIFLSAAELALAHPLRLNVVEGLVSALPIFTT